MYGFYVTLTGEFDAAVARVREELKKEGFGVVTEIDVQKTVKEKLGIDQAPYLILGACNPKLAHQAIESEPDIGLLLPCNVVVRRVPEGNVVGFMDPETVLGLVRRDDLSTLGMDVKARLMRVRDALSA